MENAPASEVSISLCMIARDEERFLGDCLASVKGTVDEIIVVDTGSEDGTREIAASAGARVLEFPWVDDFAAARNVGLDQAKGTHVLVLDADERLMPNFGEALLQGARNPNLLLGCLPLHNASTLEAIPEDVLRGRFRIGDPTFVPRLFRRLPQMRFQRRVHETLSRGFNELFSKGIGQSIAVPAPLIHYGDVHAHRKDLKKDERNEALLRRSLEDDPGDGEIAGYLVVDLLKSKRVAEAVRVGERHFAPFVQRNESRPPGFLPENMVRIGYALGLAQVELGRHAAALCTTQAARRHTPDGHPNLDYVEGLAHLGAGDLSAAERHFQATMAAATRTYAQPVLPLITGELSMLKLAGIALLRGDYPSARNALPKRSGKWAMPVDLVLAEIDLAEEKPTAAMEKLSPYVDLPSPPPDWYALVHKALTALGKEATELLDTAQAAPPSDWLERRRLAPVRQYGDRQCRGRNA